MVLVLMIMIKKKYITDSMIQSSSIGLGRLQGKCQ